MKESRATIGAARSSPPWEGDVSITVRFPAMLQGRTGATIVVEEAVPDIGALLDLLDRKQPGLAAALADPIFNMAVNDEMLLHGVRAHPLKDGDEIEVVPTIAGG
jgi:molybdopterin converting factor small subunit